MTILPVFVSLALASPPPPTTEAKVAEIEQTQADIRSALQGLDGAALQALFNAVEVPPEVPVADAKPAPDPADSAESPDPGPAR